MRCVKEHKKISKGGEDERKSKQTAIMKVNNKGSTQKEQKTGKKGEMRGQEAKKNREEAKGDKQVERITGREEGRGGNK